MLGVLWAVTTSIVLLAARLPAPERVVGVSADSATVHARLVLAISEFHVTWQRAWRQSEQQRAADPQFTGARRRLAYMHCDRSTSHARDVVEGLVSSKSDGIFRPDTQYTEVASRESFMGVCPTWLLSGGVPAARDERFGLDGALTPGYRERARAARASLLQRLDDAAAEWPADGWISGQRIRFRVDQQELDSAAADARACRASRWWCVALAGYVYAWRGDTRSAEAAFDTMRVAMTESARCAWDDVSLLLPPSVATRYRDLSCQDRAALTPTLWWMADPLYREPANARRVEQDVRHVDVLLRQATMQDERHVWDVERGGDAVAEVITRYGRPTYSAWGGEVVDHAHTGYLENYGSPPSAPYTTFEYSVGRVHTLPLWRTLSEPYLAAENDWSLSVEDSSSRALLDWWPEEHYAPARRLVQLPPVGQLAMLRRQSQVIVAAALPIQHGTLLTDTSSLDVMLLATRGASDVDTLDDIQVRGGNVAAVHGSITPSPTMLAIEAAGIGATTLDARTRRGLTPLPPLSAMRPGEIAQSAPVLFEPDASEGNVAPDEALLARMFGSLRFNATTRRIGVYWENYGIGATDTITVAIRVAGDQDISGLRRIGMALNVAVDPNRSIVQRWTEPDVLRSTRTLAGPVAVQMHAVILNLAPLAAGPYVVEISVERAHGGVTTSQQRIVLE